MSINTAGKVMIIAIPTLQKTDWCFLQELRQAYDPKNYAYIDLHFTLFSQCHHFAKHELSKNLHINLQQQKKINFCLRTAIFMPPLFQHKSWYVFLIPDEGFSELSKLHRQMGAGRLGDALDKNFPFIPHITVASFADKEDCLRLVDEINAMNITLSGSIEKIALVETVNNVASTFDEIVLR